MRKSKKFLSFTVVAFVCLVGVIAVNAANNKNFTQRLNAWSGFYEMAPSTKQNTSNEGYVKMSNMGGASSLGFKARGKWWNGKQWLWTNFGPTSTVNNTSSRFIVYYMQSMSYDMPIYLSVRNNTNTSSRPTVSGNWQYDR